MDPCVAKDCGHFDCIGERAPICTVCRKKVDLTRGDISVGAIKYYTTVVRGDAKIICEGCLDAAPAPAPPVVPAAPRVAGPPARSAVFEHDPRVASLVGQSISCTKHGVQHTVLVLADGFEYDGVRYRSLSAVGKLINDGKSTNGFVFFGLGSR